MLLQLQGPQGHLKYKKFLRGQNFGSWYSGIVSLLEFQLKVDLQSSDKKKIKVDLYSFGIGWIKRQK